MINIDLVFSNRKNLNYGKFVHLIFKYQDFSN